MRILSYESLWTGRKKGFFLTITANLIWGTTFVATGAGLRYINPYNLVFLRFATASLFIVAIAIATRRVTLIVRDLRCGSIWLLGGIYALGFVFQYVGQDLTNASDATLLANLAPTLVPLIAFMILKDSIGNVQKTATALGLTGLILIAAPKLSLGSGTVIGDLLLFGTSACYAVFIVLSKRYGAVSSVGAFAIMVSVGIFLAPVAIFLGGLNHTNLNIGLIGWSSVLYLGVPGSAIAVALYLKGLGSITASQSATLLLVQLLTGLFLAILILHEFPTPFEIAGAISTFAAVALSSVGIRGKDR